MSRECPTTRYAKADISNRSQYKAECKADSAWIWSAEPTKSLVDEGAHSKVVMGFDAPAGRETTFKVCKVRASRTWMPSGLSEATRRPLGLTTQWCEAVEGQTRDGGREQRRRAHMGKLTRGASQEGTDLGLGYLETVRLVDKLIWHPSCACKSATTTR